MKQYLLFFVFVYITGCFDLEDPTCKAARIESKPALNGIVKKKYIEEHNHDYRVLEISQDGEKRYKLYFGEFMNPNFYHYVEVGDAIKKSANSLTYQVVKQNGRKKDFFLNFNCPDTLSLPR
ncbi:MAG: hypothetical protein HUU01_15225 [Saprospiraceae bacterium]|nr:hypothetical protein [Saprospiraceae bacterium]